MKKYLIILLMGIFFSSFSAKAQQPETKTKSPAVKSKVEVYYFHGDRRCTTCKAVGSVSKDFLTQNYAEEIKAGTVFYHDVNYDQAENKELAKKMEVSGSSLLVKKTTESEISIENLTNLAFMYAIANPQKLKNAIKKEVDSLN